MDLPQFPQPGGTGELELWPSDSFVITLSSRPTCDGKILIDFNTKINKRSKWAKFSHRPKKNMQRVKARVPTDEQWRNHSQSVSGCLLLVR